MKNAYGETTYATAAEVSRNFGRWQDQALAGPVVVTHHGRPRVVVMSAQQYENLTEEPADGFAEDPPETARLEEALAALQAFQRATSGGAIRLTRRGVIAAIDEAVAQLMGVTSEEAVGVTLTDLIDAAERRRLTTALEACFEEGAGCQLALRRLARAGDGPPITLGLAPLLRNGLIDGVAVAVTPATPRQETDGEW